MGLLIASRLNFGTRYVGNIAFVGNFKSCGNEAIFKYDTNSNTIESGHETLSIMPLT